MLDIGKLIDSGRFRCYRPIHRKWSQLGSTLLCADVCRDRSALPIKWSLIYPSWIILVFPMATPATPWKILLRPIWPNRIFLYDNSLTNLWESSPKWPHFSMQTTNTPNAWHILFGSANHFPWIACRGGTFHWESRAPSPNPKISDFSWAYDWWEG